MKVTASLLVFIAAITQTFALDNGLGRTPQMGWNSWSVTFDLLSILSGISLILCVKIVPNDPFSFF
jgi:hypothetical protein